MAPLRFLAAAAALAASLHCAASPFTVQLGDTRVALDGPPGYSDASATGSPRMIELAESLTSASNRILLFGISDADLRRFTVGESPEFRRYMIAVTPKGLEYERITAAAFAVYVSDTLKGLGDVPPAAAADPVKYLEAQEVGRPSPIVELKRDAGEVSLLVGTRLPPVEGGMFKADKQRFMLSSTTLLLLRGKALNLQMFTLYESPADMEWMRTTTARWIEELRRLNSR
jgi:hypothetical protein